MIAKKFITDCVTKISLAFPNVTISYKFDLASETHYLKVIPQEVQSSESFQDLESELYVDWYKNPNHLGEAFCIVSSDSLVQVDEDEILYMGEYDQASSHLEKSALIVEFIGFSTGSDVRVESREFEVENYLVTDETYEEDSFYMLAA